MDCDKLYPLITVLMGLDSVELVMDVEKHFSISIPDPEAEKAHTVGKLVDCVANILGMDNYDFGLRDRTFSLIKASLESLVPDIPGFSLTSKVSDSLDIKDRTLINSLETALNLELPNLHAKGFLDGMLKRLPFFDTIDFRTITWKRYVDIILSHNLYKLTPPIQYTSKYEIYIAIMRITVDKVGVGYQEIGLEKSFTDDLGID
jgi:general stress protein CsbA